MQLRTPVSVALLALSSTSLPPLAAQACGEGSLAALGAGTPGAGGVPSLDVVGAPLVELPFAVAVRGGPAGGAGVLAVGATETPTFLPAYGATLYPSTPLGLLPFVLDPEGGSAPLPGVAPVPAGLCGVELVVQAAVADPAAAGGLAFTQAWSVAFGAAPSDLLFRQQYFRPAVSSFALGQALALADVDGDGALDALSAAADLFEYEPAPGTVRLFSGQGDGAFQPGQGQGSYEAPSAIAAGDFDGDGLTDAALADPGHFDLFNPSPGALWILGSAGALGLVEAASPAVGLRPRDVAAADFDGDGNLDVVTANEGSDDVSIVLGGGDLTFAAATNAAVGGVPSSVRVADLDADGTLDLAVLNLGSGDATLLGGGGDGTFTPLGTLAVGTSTQALAAGDLGVDGVPELVTARFVSSDESWVEVYAGLGSGAFGPPVATSVAPETRSLTLADVGGDGTLDLIASGSETSVLAGLGDGSLAPPARYLSSKQVAVADLDQDGAVDLVSELGSGIGVLRGLGGGVFPADAEAFLDATASDLVAEDFDADGQLDLAAVRFFGGIVSVALGTAPGAVGPWTDYAAPAGSISSGAAGDVTGDGALDLIAVGFGGPGPDALSLFPGAGDGTFATAVTYPVAENHVWVELADLDLDGDLDAAASSSEDEVSVLYGESGGFGPAQVHPVGLRPMCLEVVDLDLDGWPDLVTANEQSKDLSLLLGGAAGFAPATTLDSPSGAHLVAAADMNDDGWQDLIVAGSQSSVAVFAGTGGAVFGAPVAVGGALGSPEDLAVADFNADLVPDVLVSAALLQFYPGSGDGSLGSAETFRCGVWATALQSVEWSGDTVLDLVVSSHLGVRFVRNPLLAP
ncbi:MAG: VCBS repeat-containing protein [Planctomycetota bacterium]